MVAVAALERDAELMLRVRDGDSLSFSLLLEKHRAPVVSFLSRMVQNQAIAEELAQEVFFRVFRSGPPTSQQLSSPLGCSGSQPTWR
jgi:RNA polymerase sigma-70 factor (ECF subfamily)